MYKDDEKLTPEIKKEILISYLESEIDNIGQSAEEEVPEACAVAVKFIDDKFNDLKEDTVKEFKYKLKVVKSVAILKKLIEATNIMLKEQNKEDNE